MKEDPLFKKYHKEHLSKKSSHWHVIKKLGNYLKPYSKWVLLSLFVLLLARVIDVSIPIYIGKIIQTIINYSSSNEDRNPVLTYMWQGGLLIVSLVFLSYVFDMLSMIVKNWVAQKALFSMRSEVYDHIQQLPLKTFDRVPVGRLITRTIHDVEQINMMFVESVIPLIGSLLLFIGMIFGMYFINWHVALGFALIVPIVYWLTYRFQYYQHYCYEVIRNIVSAKNTFVQEYLSGVSTVRTFGLEKREKIRFDELNRDHYIANIESTHHFSYFVSGIDLLQSLSLIVAFVILVIYAPKETGFQAGSYFAFSLYALMFFRPLIDLADRYNILQSALSAADRIFTLLDEPIERKNGSEVTLNDIQTITFEDVWFSYDNTHWVLKGLSFSIENGESVALIGQTGAGKSTIISLLLRFYDIQKGTIKINGINIQEYPLKQLRKQFSIVLQDPVIFAGTVKENISLYKERITTEKIENVVEYLNLTPFIQRMSNGLEHHLPHRGETLSAGERQLVSLARAVAHERPVLILDEATANIDTATEKVIQSALKKILKNQTSLVVAHRLSTIQDVHRILVLHEGTVVESGKHEELLAQKGLYEKLYRLQFANGK